MTDLAQMVELQQSLTILGTIGGLALALLGAGLAAVLLRHRLRQGHRHRRRGGHWPSVSRTPASSARS